MRMCSLANLVLPKVFFLFLGDFFLSLLALGLFIKDNLIILVYTHFLTYFTRISNFIFIMWSFAITTLLNWIKWTKLVVRWRTFTWKCVYANICLPLLLTVWLVGNPDNQLNASLYGTSSRSDEQHVSVRAVFQWILYRNDWSHRQSGSHKCTDETKILIWSLKEKLNEVALK